MYRFYTYKGGQHIEIFVKHTPLAFKFEKFDNRLCWDFKRTLTTELVFIDDPKKADTPDKINKSYSYLRGLLSSYVQRVRIQIYRDGIYGAFWDGWITLPASDENAWDTDKRVFRAKGFQNSINSKIEKLGDKEINIQGLPGLVTCTDSDTTVYDNGRTLRDTLDYLLQQSDVQIAVASDVLPILGTIGVDDLIVYDKSDVKRPEVSNNATITKVTLKRLIDNICNLFNVKYTTEGNIFTFKHYTEIFRNEFDLAEKVLGFYNNSFSYLEIPGTENLKSEESKTEEFQELQIEYEIEGGSKEEYNLSNLCVDLNFIIGNRNRLAADPDAKDEISDSGLFFAAIDGSNVILEQTGVKNYQFSYTFLFPILWEADRYLNRFKLNGGEATFVGIDRRVRRQKLDMDFFNEFRELNLFKVDIEKAEIETAELKGNKLSLNLLFPF